MNTVDPNQLTTEGNLHLCGLISFAAKIDPIHTAKMYRLSEDTVHKLAALTLPQILRISKSPSFLFTVDEERLKALLKDEASGTGYGSMECIIQHHGEIRGQS